jgi:hypothetical protein
MRKVNWWTIKVQWEDEEGKPLEQEYIADIPNWVADHVDDFLTELEGERNG